MGDRLINQMGGLFTRALYTAEGQQTFDELRRRCPDLVEVDSGPGGLTLTLGS